MENIIEPDNFTEEQLEILDAMIDAEQDEDEDMEQSGGALPMEEDMYDIQEIQQRFIRKFNTVGTDYSIAIRPNVPRGDIMQFMSQVMTSILERITRNMEPTDLVRFIMQAPDLSYPIGTCQRLGCQHVGKFPALIIFCLFTRFVAVFV